MNKFTILTICLCLSAIFTFAFGFAINIYYVIVLRFLIGMVSGVSIIDKAIIHAVCNEGNQSIGMLFYGIGVAGAQTIAPLIGGYMQNPVKLYPKVFGDNYFFVKFPYFLTSICVLCILTVNIVLVLITQHSQRNRLPAINSRSVMTSGDVDEFESTAEAFKRIIKYKMTAISLGIYMLYSLVTIAIDELFVVFLSTALFDGGLGFSSKQIGTFLIFSSLPSIFIHIIIFTQLIHKIGIIQSIKVCHLIMVPLILAVPFSYYYWDRYISEMVLLYVTYILIKICGNVNSGTTSLLVNNSVKLEDIGSVNGIGLSMACAFRALAPITFDSIYSASISLNLEIGKIAGGLIAFSSIGVFTVIISILCCYIPTSLNSRRI